MKKWIKKIMNKKKKQQKRNIKQKKENKWNRVNPTTTKYYYYKNTVGIGIIIIISKIWINSSIICVIIAIFKKTAAPTKKDLLGHGQTFHIEIRWCR